MVRSALLLPLLLGGARAFAPVPPGSSSVRKRQSADTRMNQMFPQSSALEVADEDGSAADPYDAYAATDDQKEIAIRDTKIGTGYAVGDAEDQLLEIKYTAKFVDGKFTANIREFDVPSTVFKTGESRILPGLEEGLMGMKVGGVRKVKVPPNKGYGDGWYRGIVPPNSHLEFDCTLVKIAQSPGEEFMMKLEQFGIERAVGAAICLAYLAISPVLEQKGII